jgi:hypothetical protein
MINNDRKYTVGCDETLILEVAATYAACGSTKASPYLGRMPSVHPAILQRKLQCIHSGTTPRHARIPGMFLVDIQCRTPTQLLAR